MKKELKSIAIILLCLFLCGCDYLQFPTKTDSSEEMTDGENQTEEVKQSESISEAKNISLTAQDDGILITVTKEDDWDISNIWIVDKTNNIEINPNFSQIKWENNKAEILYPFSEKGKIYKFFLGNHDIEQECEILATGGSGYPFMDSFKELRLIPDYNANDNTFSVQFNIEQQSFSDYCTAIVTDNNSEYINPYIHINCILGDIENPHKAYFGWYNISSNDMLPGPYTITTDQSNIYTYEDYENKYYAELFFGFHRIIGDNRICFQVLDIDCSETKILKDTEFTTTEKFIPASDKNISLKAQENGILITLTKEDDWDVSNLWIKNIEDEVEINVGLSNIKWVDNKAEILYPFSEKEKKYKFWLTGNNINQQCAIHATGGNGYPFNNSFQELKLISSYNSENNTFFVTLNTEPQKFSDFVSCILNDRSLEFTNPYIHIDLYLGDRNKKCIWYGCSNIFSEDILPGTFQIGNYTTKPYEYSAYENKYFVEMFLSITKKVGENEIFFQFYNKASSDYKTISNTEFLTTENNNDEIKPVINLVPTENGIQINVTELPSDARGIQIRKEGKGHPLFELFNYKEDLDFPSEIQVYDFFVNQNTKYGYYVDVYFKNDENWSKNIRTRTIYSTSSGGLGELEFEMTASSDGIILSMPISSSLNVEYIRYNRHDSLGHFQDIWNFGGNNFTVTDYFVALNTLYSYEPQVAIPVIVPIDGTNNINGRYTPAVEPKTIKTPASNCGYGEITIINSPAATWANSKITFTVAPEISVSELPLGVRISQIGFIYRKVGDIGFNHYLFYGDEELSWEQGTYFPSELSTTGDKGYYIELSGNDGHSWSVYRQPDHLFEGMPQTIVID